MSTVLLVDDNAVLAYFTARNLQRDLPGFEVVIAASCAEAKEEARKIPPMLLISDYKLPDGNGVELIREFAGVYPDCAAILISGENVPEDEIADVHFVMKPYEAETLLDMARETLSRRVASAPPVKIRHVSTTCKGYDRHHVQNRLAGLLAGLRAFGADIRAQADDERAVREFVDEYLDRLCSVVVEVSGALPVCPKEKLLD
jgi:DNA-binding response OmpR family regulator